LTVWYLIFHFLAFFTHGRICLAIAPVIGRLHVLEEIEITSTQSLSLKALIKWAHGIIYERLGVTCILGVGTGTGL
jgi:hypothetical protein